MYKQIHNKSSKKSFKKRYSNNLQLGGIPIENVNNQITSQNSMGSVLNKKISFILQSITKYAAKTIDGFIDPTLTEKSLKDITPNIHQNVETLRKFLLVVSSDDAEMKQLIKKTVVLFSKYLTEVLNESQPEVDIAINKFWSTFNNIAEKSATGFTNASLTAAYAALAEIPGIGGFIVLLGSGGKFFNTDMLIANEVVDGANEMKDTVENMTAISNKYIEKYKPEIENIHNEYLNKAEKYSSNYANIEKDLTIPSKIDSVKMTGGKKKSKNTLKRIINSFKIFTRKHRHTIK